MNKLKASVIVPTYNRKKLLNYTLESLSKQTMNKEEYEIIICDDGSNDNTFELIRKYEKMMNIKYCYHTHDSFRVALTRNMGINIARGEIEYSANGRPLVTVEKSTQYADQVHLAQKLNTLKSPLWI